MLPRIFRRQSDDEEPVEEIGDELPPADDGYAPVIPFPVQPRDAKFSFDRLVADWTDLLRQQAECERRMAQLAVEISNCELQWTNAVAKMVKDAKA